MSKKCSEPQLDYIDLIGRILRDVPRLESAACRGRQDIFTSDDPADIDDAIDVCLNQCSQLAACRDWASQLKCHERQGTYAGVYHPWISHPSMKRKAVNQ